MASLADLQQLPTEIFGNVEFHASAIIYLFSVFAKCKSLSPLTVFPLIKIRHPFAISENFF
jgi:hypothetical protein